MLLPQHCGKLKPAEICLLERSLKLHFTNKKYRYDQYGGKVRYLNLRDFEQRKDYPYYAKLAEHARPGLYMLANISKRPKWDVFEMLSAEGERTYLQWQGIQDSLTYRFKRDIELLSDNGFKEAFRVVGSEYPVALKLLMQDQITRESILILDSKLSFLEYWQKKIADAVLWPDLLFNLRRYSSFVDMDWHKYERILHEQLQHA